MRDIRRKEKAIENIEEIHSILERTKYITIALCQKETPYLVTLSHGFDKEKNCIYFHCAKDGKKIEILSHNPQVWGQALLDHGYVDGQCDHLYSSVHFKGEVTFVSGIEEKRHALFLMIQALDSQPGRVMREQITDESVAHVNIGRIDIEYMSGKKSKEVVISL